MVAVVTGNGLGLASSSASVLGAGGQLGGSAVAGQGGETAYVNAQTGNLVIQRQDEYLVGRGPDIGVVRTYNSGASFDFDNGDDWQLSLYRRLTDRIGDFNAEGSRITRHGADGAQLIYRYDVSQNKYINTDGGGAYDSLSYDATNNSWTWTDGDSQISETYAGHPDVAGEWRITRVNSLDANDPNRKLTGLNGAINSANSLIQRYGADGVLLTYRYDAVKGVYTNTDGGGAYDSLSYDAASDIWTWTDGDSRIAEIYAAVPGAPGEWCLADLSYHYDANGLIDRATGANGEYTQLNYNANKLTSLRVVTINADGTLTGTTRTRYTYDAEGRLATVSTDLTPNNGSIADGNTYTTTYTYDGSGANTRLASIANSDGTLTRFTYDDNRRVKTVIDGLGQTTTFIYETGYTKVKDALGQISRLDYDDDGNLTGLQGPTGSGQDVHYDYDAADGDLTQHTDSRGNHVVYSHDGQGNLTREQDAAGNVTTHEYNADNQLIRTVAYAVPDPDGAGSGQAGTAQTTYYLRDAKQHLRYVVSPQGRVTEYRYDERGQRTASLSYAAATYTAGGAPTEAALAAWAGAQDLTRIERTDYAYDLRGQVNSATRYAGTDAAGAGVAGSGAQTWYVYDSAGRLRQRIDPRGMATPGTANDYLTAYGYDGLGRTISVTAYDGAGKAVGSGGTRQTLTAYLGNRIEVTLGNGLKRVTSFDARGLVQDQVELDGTTVLSTVAYQYDAAGRLRVVTDANGHKTYTLYDIGGRKSGEIDADGGLTEWIYNGNGQVVRHHRYATAVGVDLATLFAADAVGAIADVTLAAVRPAATANDPQTRFIYDAAGRLRFSVDASGYVTETRYDGTGRRLASLAYANALNHPAGLDGLGREARPEDILLLTSAPTGSQIGLRLDAARDRVSRDLYDNDGLLRGQLDGEGYLTEFKYDAAGRLTQAIRYGTASAAADRLAGTLDTLIASANADPANTIQNFVYYNGLGQAIGSLDGEGYYTAYQYDLAGNRTQTTRYANRLVGAAVPNKAPKILSAAPETIPAGGYLLSSDQDQTNRTTWTAFNQIDSETGADGTLSKHSYDRVGHRLSSVIAQGSADSRTLQARYDLQGRLIQELTPLGSQALAALGASPTPAQIDAVWTAYGTTHTYDAGGRRIRSVDANGGVTLYYYDAANRLTYSVRWVKNPADANEWQGEVGARQYNALGQLTAEIRYANYIDTSHFDTLSGGDEAQIQATGVIVANSSLDSRTDYTYRLTGQLGTSTVKLDASQNAVTERFYDGFGQLTALQTALDATRTRREEYLYDRRGLLVEDRRDVAWAGNATATGVVVKADYDAFGRVVGRTDGTGVRDTVVYDKRGRQIQTVADAGGLNLTRSATYDAFDRGLSQTDALGHTTTMAYAVDTATGRTTLTVTTPEQIVTQRVVDRHGQTLTVIDGLGNETRYGYDANGNLLTTKRWDKAANVETTLATNTYDTAGQRLFESRDGNGHVVRYGYDAAGRILTRTVDPDGLALVTAYAYDAKGQTVSVTAGGVVTQTTYDQAGRVVRVAVDPDGLNLRTQYTYDLTGHQVTVVEGEGATTRTTQYDYDSLGRRTRAAVDPSGLNLVTTYAYDANDNLIAKTDAAASTTLARTTRYAYDADNRLIYTVDALGGTVKHDYDAEGRVVRTTAYANAVDPAGLAANPSLATIAATVVADAAKDRSTRYAYDDDGRLRFTIDALGAVTENRYDANGNVSRRIAYATPLTGSYVTGSLPTVGASGSQVVTHAADRHTVYTYDAFNRLASLTEGEGTAAARSETWAYDTAGNVVRHSDGRGNREWFAYDAANRQIRHIDQGGYVTDTAWNADGSKQSETRWMNAVALPGGGDDFWAYAGHAADPTADTDAASGDRTTSYTYDKAGRTLTRTDALGQVIRYAYDALGHVIDTTVAYGTSAATTLRRTYDLAGRVLTETRAYGTPDAATTRYTYDALGNQITIAVADGTPDTLQEFDRLGRKVAVTDGNGATTRTTYNAFGDIVKVVDAHGNAGYFYADALGRVTLQVDPEGAVTETRYDLQGNVTDVYRYANKVVGAVDETTRPQIRTSTGSGVHVVVKASADAHQQTLYDALGRKSEVRTWWGPNAADYYTEAFGYDADGHVLTATARNGATTTYEYDTLGRKVRETLPITSKAANTTQVAVQNRYAYDALGNLTVKTEAYGLPEQRVTRYAYDKLNRQTREIGESFATFDPVTRTETTVTEPTRQTLYDVRGNLVEEIDAKGHRTLHFYDKQDREVGRVDAAGTYTTWGYDAAGHRTRQTTYANAVKVKGGGAISTAAAPKVLASTPSVNGTAYVLIDSANDRTVHTTYDGVGRVTGSRIEAMTVGAYEAGVAGGQYRVGTDDVTTGIAYDALGHVIKTVDGNGQVTRSYYDRAGQPIGQLDAGGYLTVWERDALGNAKREIRYANAVDAGLLVTDATTLTELTAHVAAGADDRITVATYDKLNRVTGETRMNVAGGRVNSANGYLTEDTVDAVTRYVYDGLNNVVQQTDAVGAVTDWDYDGLGRKTKEQRPGYVDYLGNTVRPTSEIVYDGLNRVSAEVARGTDDSTSTDDRITRYGYSPGGHLASRTDATGVVTRFQVDANGNVTATTLVGRGNADDATTVDDVTLYQYDALNRQVKSTDVGTGATQEVRYNAFGEITGKRSNGGGTDVAWQEFADYDRAGRLWRGNSGDGVTRVYVHDGNGNATLAIESGGASLAGRTLAELLADPATLKTVSVYDARNQLTDTYRPTSDAVGAFVAVAAGSVGQAVYADGEIDIAIGTQAIATPAADPITSGSLSVGPATVTVGGTQTASVSQFGELPAQMARTMVIDAFPDTTALGTGTVKVVAEKTVLGVTTTQIFYTEGAPINIIFGAYTLSTSFDTYGNPIWDPIDQHLTLRLFKQLGDGREVQIGGDFVPDLSSVQDGAWSSASANPCGLLFGGQPPETTRLVLAYRPQGSTGPYTLIDVPRVMTAASTWVASGGVAGRFALDWSQSPLGDPLAGGLYDIQYLALDSSGAVVNQQAGLLDLRQPAAPVATQTSGELATLGAAGRGLITHDGQLNLFGQGNATTLILKYRVKGSGGEWTTVTLDNAGPFGVAAPGWFSLAYADTFGAGTAYELDLTAKNRYGTVVSRARAEFSRDAAGAASVSAFTAYADQDATVHFGEAADTAYLDVYYRAAGSTGAYTSKRLYPSPAGSGRFDWVAADLVPDPGLGYDYELLVKAYGPGSQFKHTTAATLRLGAQAAVVAVTVDAPPAGAEWLLRDVGGADRAHRSQAHNAFGEVVQETDALGHTTDYAYNSLGRLVLKRDPETDVTLANGYIERLRPETRYVYDWTGRLIASVDANGRKSSQVWLAGSDAVGLERQADGTLVRHDYDIFGDKRVDTDSLGGRTEADYDKMGRVVEIRHPERAAGTVGNMTASALRAVDKYAYDAAGNRIRHTNAADDTEETRYDSLGRITLSRSYLGFETAYRYDWYATIQGVDGLRTGGWKTTTTDATGRTLADNRDVFGHLTWHKDLGGRTFAYAYDAAGRLVHQTGSNGQDIVTGYDAAGTIASVWDRATGAYSHYGYDANGNRVFEGYAVLKNPAELDGGVLEYYQRSHLDYDALGRLVHVVDSQVEIDYEYDAVGNRRRVVSQYRRGADGKLSTKDYWYAYDQMNRFTVVMGTLAKDGAATTVRGVSADDATVTIGKGSTGVSFAYDGAGRRREAWNGSDGLKETYRYSADGYLEEVDVNGVLRNRRYLDKLGRVKGYFEWNRDGGLAVEAQESSLGRRLGWSELQDATGATRASYHQISFFDADNRLLRRADTDGLTLYYYFGANGGPNEEGAGALCMTATQQDGTSVYTHYAYDYWDTAQQKAITAQPYNPALEGNNDLWKRGYAKFVYDVNGHLVEAFDAGKDGTLGSADDGHARYVNDARGQILVRDELIAASEAGPVSWGSLTGEITATRANPVHRYYYAAGMQVGMVNNDGEPGQMDYVQAMVARQADPKDYSQWTPVSSSNFDPTYQAIGPTYPGMASSTYTARGGDTLQGIALAVWGDASLWYLIADANGLTGSEALNDGQVLGIPNKVANYHNSASTFRPYDPGAAIGDTSPTIPTAPPPPEKDDGCGGIGQIIVAIVAVVATIITAGVAVAALSGVGVSGATLAELAFAGASALTGTSIAGIGVSIAAAAIGGAVGSIAGQLTGMAIGVQDKFSWSAVAAGALSTAAMAGLGSLNGGKGLFPDSSFLNAAAGNVVNQGINILTGQQDGFSWTSLAASAISAPLIDRANEALFTTAGPGGVPVKTDWVRNNPLQAKLAMSTVSALVAATTRVAIEGGRLNWASVAADALSGTVRAMYASPQGAVEVKELPKETDARKDFEARVSAYTITSSEQLYDYNGNEITGAAQGVDPGAQKYRAMEISSQLNASILDKSLAAILLREDQTISRERLLEIGKQIDPSATPFFNLIDKLNYSDANIREYVADIFENQARQELILVAAIADVGGLVEPGHYAAAVQELGLSNEQLLAFINKDDSNLGNTKVASLGGAGSLGLNNPLMDRLLTVGEKASPWLSLVAPQAGAALSAIVTVARAAQEWGDISKLFDQIKSHIAGANPIGLEDQVVSNPFGEAMELAFKIVNRAQDRIDRMLGRGLTGAVAEAVNAGLDYFKKTGAMGEHVARFMLEASGLFEDGSIRTVQNASGHGIDLMGKALSGRDKGYWTVIELKTSTTGRAPGLSDLQRMGADRFADDVLRRRIIGNDARWNDPDFYAFAQQVLKEQRNRDFNGIVISTTYVNDPTRVKVKIGDWRARGI